MKNRTIEGEELSMEEEEWRIGGIRPGELGGRGERNGKLEMNG